MGVLSKGIRKMSRDKGCDSLDDYYFLLAGTETDSRHWDDLIDEITIGETYFFRDGAQIRVLKHHILPELISRHRHDRRLRMWSAGCASGEEPYTIAILLSQLLKDSEGWYVTILATDINRKAVEKAQKGIYREWSFRQTDPADRFHWFRPKKNGYEVISRIREMVTFGYLNLSEKCYPSLATNTNAIDLILCRNVAIYQSEEAVRRVTTRFHKCLMTGGWLMVGASETAIPVYGQFAARNVCGATVFQKVAEPVSSPTQSVPEMEACPNHERIVVPPIQKAQSLSPAIPIPSQPRIQDDRNMEIKREGADNTGQLSSHYAEGIALLKEKRFDEALNLFQACFAMDPGYTPALFQLGQVHANLGHLEEAQSWCQQVLEKDPLMVEAHYTLALVLQEKGELERAADRIQKALFLDPNFILAHFSLSILYRQLEKKGKAVRHINQAVQMASRMEGNTILPGSGDLTAAQMLTMAKAMK